MAMHTEEFCRTLDALSKEVAIRAIHEAYLQLAALTKNVDCGCYDNKPALASLEACMVAAGHLGFPAPEPAKDVAATRVLFRKDRSGEVTAVFPDVSNGGTFVACYSHVGQHSSCSPEWVRYRTRPAKPEEYASLKAELEAEPFGYRLDVIANARSL